MPSFDIVSKADFAEVDNAINGALREISNRYDFKDSKSDIIRNENDITLIGDDNYKIDQVQQILRTYFVRRKVDTGFLEFESIQNSSGGLLKQNAKLKLGIDREISQKINKEVKSKKIKVQLEIRGDEIRISSKELGIKHIGIRH